MLLDVVSALNNEVTSLIGKKPAVAIKEKEVFSKPSTKHNRPVGQAEKKLPPLIHVRYSYQPGELEGGTKRATDPIWSLKVYQIVKTLPSQMSLLSIICLTVPNAALFVKSCWLCRLIPSCRQPEMAVCRRADAVICYPSLCVKWRYGDLVHAHSIHLVAFNPQYFHLVHELLSLKERFFVVLVRYLLLNHIFFSRPSPSLCFFRPLPPSTSWASLQRLPLSLLPHIHLSSCLKPSFMPRAAPKIDINLAQKRLK